MNVTQYRKSGLKKLAQAGLVAKGIVYCLLGAFAFLAAFHIGKTSIQDANKQGVVQWIQQLPAGYILLSLLMLGLVCYSIWRFIQAFANSDHEAKNTKGWLRRAVYFFSGLIYLGLSISIFKILTNKSGGNNQNANEQVASSVLDKPMGQWALGLVALMMLAAGIYQIWYGFSEKYRKHVNDLNRHSNHSALLLRSGKFGYIARGAVWLILAWLFFNAAIHAKAEEAADTNEAFQYVSEMPWGTYLLGAMGAGLVCYGIFSFIRSRYEHLA